MFEEYNLPATTHVLAYASFEKFDTILSTDEEDCSFDMRVYATGTNVLMAHATFNNPTDAFQTWTGFQHEAIGDAMKSLLEKITAEVEQEKAEVAKSVDPTQVEELKRIVNAILGVMPR